MWIFSTFLWLQSKKISWVGLFEHSACEESSVCLKIKLIKDHRSCLHSCSCCTLGIHRRQQFLETWENFGTLWVAAGLKVIRCFCTPCTVDSYKYSSYKYNTLSLHWNRLENTIMCVIVSIYAYVPYLSSEDFSKSGSPDKNSRMVIVNNGDKIDTHSASW